MADKDKKSLRDRALSGPSDFTKSMFGQGKFRDTGRESEGLGESIDSLVGAPARLAIDEFRKGNINLETLKKTFTQIGADPRTAPTGYDIASQITDDPTLGTILATAIDVGAQLPIPGVGIAGKVEDLSKLPKILKEVNTAEKAVALKGAKRGEYLKALEEVYGDQAKRAKDLGFGDQTWYHGTKNDIDSFDVSKSGLGTQGRGVYFDSDGKISTGYSSRPGGNVIPAKVRGDFLNGMDSISKNQIQDLKKVLPDKVFKYMKNNYDLEPGKNELRSVFRRAAVEKDSEGLTDVSGKMIEALGATGLHTPGRELTVYDPKNIRSTNAAFDPRFKDSDLLLAGKAGINPLTSPINVQPTQDKKGYAQGGAVKNQPMMFDDIPSAAPSGQPSNQMMFDDIPDAGSGMQGAIGFAEQVGKGALGPLSTMAEVAFGVPRKDIKAREDAAGTATKVAGQAAGLLGSMFIPGGQAKLLAGAGKALIPALAHEAPMIAKIGTAAATAAVENALYQAGDEVSKKLLNDPEQTAGSALMNIGTAGLIGGALGGAIGSVHPLWEASVGKKADGFLKSLTSKINREPIVQDAGNVITKDQIFDPFTKEVVNKSVDIPVSPKTTTFDPFLKKAVGTAEVKPEAVLDSIPKEVMTDFLSKKLSKFVDYIPEGVVGAASTMMGVDPYLAVAATHAAKKLGIISTEAFKNSLLNFVKSAAPIDSAAWKVSADYLNAAIKGQLKIQRAAKSVISPARITMPKFFIPDAKSRTKLNKELQNLKVDQSKLFEMGGKIGHYLPEHQSAMAQMSMHAINYVESLRPKDETALPFDPKPKVSAYAQAQFDRVLDLAEQPLLAFEAIKKGNLNQKDVMHIKVMYPKLYEQMSEQLYHSVLENDAQKNPIPYKQRMAISLFLGQPLDSTMTPASIQAAQAAVHVPLEDQQSQGGQMMKSSTGNMSKMAKSAQTSAQAREANKSIGS